MQSEVESAGRYAVGRAGRAAALVAVSDFVTPYWYREKVGADFGPTHYLTAPLDPFQLAPGGYVVRRFPDGTEDQQFGRTAKVDYLIAKRHQLARTTRRVSGSTKTQETP